MKVIKQFICEYCGASHETELACKEHEDLHCDIDQIESCSYLEVKFSDSDRRLYPNSVNVRMKDGKFITYHRR